uniref:Elp3 domain-containing protein n=1 Tax=Soboliphyme baturini TaxID=241478 RepID=A0A183J7J4_9BILA
LPPFRCLNRCTYCKTRQARGNLISYQLEDIVNQARTAFREGVKEIWLTSEDLGAYGRDIGLTLPDLLQALVDVIPDGCMMRLGMTNPPYILDYLDEICAVLLHPRVYSFLHIPVQSGSDAVLSAMRREYTAGDFERVVDVDFEETVRLVKKYRFPVLFVNQFYPRPGTVAAKMKRIDGKTVVVLYYYTLLYCSLVMEFVCVVIVFIPGT